MFTSCILSQNQPGLWQRYRCLALASAAVLIWAGASFAAAVEYQSREKIIGNGELRIDTTINERDFTVGATIDGSVRVQVNAPYCKELFQGLTDVHVLIRAERIFDREGRYHQISNAYGSTVLTPSGLPIENSALACGYENGIEFRLDIHPPGEDSPNASTLTPFYHLISIPAETIRPTETGIAFDVRFSDVVPADVLEGYYRFQIMPLAKRDGKFFRLNFLPLFNNVAHTAWEKPRIALANAYSPVIKVGAPNPPKMIWALFTGDYSKGTQGIIAQEDKDTFQLSSRHIISAKFILPPSKKRTYILEPDFPTISLHPALKLELAKQIPYENPLPLNYASGAMSVRVEEPDGKIIDLGQAMFKSQSALGATTKNKKFRYRFRKYGRYHITLAGWIEDIWGNRYSGGGTYELWAARPLTFVTSVKPGMPFAVGSAYPPSIIVHPPFPAKVTVDVKLYRNSSTTDVKQMSISGQANRFGYFYPREKFEPLAFDAPGEYLADITAEYKDKRGMLWVGTQRSGSVVVAKDTPVTVFGAAPYDSSVPLEPRFNTEYEARFQRNQVPDLKDYTVCTVYQFPYHAGDILFLANTFWGDNGIRPILTAQLEGKPLPLISTSTNNYQPQGYPEFLKTQCYGYMSAMRSGFIARYLISADAAFLWDAYWQSGGNFAGHQYNNSYNGDLPQDVYGFLGGVVYRDLINNINHYGIYASLAIITPAGTFANRVVEPLSEPLFELNGRERYLMDVGAPVPGLVFETGDILRAGAMVIPPIKGVDCQRTVTTPSGKKLVFIGKTNPLGLAKLVAPEGSDIPIPEPGVYEVETVISCNGKTDIDRSHVYAVNKDQSASYFRLRLPHRFRIRYNKTLPIRGVIGPQVKDARIYYTLITPGIVMDEGVLPLTGRKFQYDLLPADFAVQYPNYDVVDYLVDPNRQMMADTLIFTFFLDGIDQSNNPIHDVKRFIIRADKGLYLD